MPRTTPRVFLATMLAAFFLLTLSFFHQPSPPSPAVRAPGHVDPTPVQARVSDEMLGGGVVMPHLGNATAKWVCSNKVMFSVDASSCIGRSWGGQRGSFCTP